MQSLWSTALLSVAAVVSKAQTQVMLSNGLQVPISKNQNQNQSLHTLDCPGTIETLFSIHTIIGNIVSFDAIAFPAPQTQSWNTVAC